MQRGHPGASAHALDVQQGWRLPAVTDRTCRPFPARQELHGWPIPTALCAWPREAAATPWICSSLPFWMTNSLSDPRNQYRAKSRETLIVGLVPAGLGFIWLHKFRATFCTRAIWATEDFALVQRWMGHEDVESTMRYVRAPRGKAMRDKSGEHLGCGCIKCYVWDSSDSLRTTIGPIATCRIISERSSIQDGI